MGQRLRSDIFPLWPEFWNLDKSLRCSVTFAIILPVGVSDENGREKKQKFYIYMFFFNWYFEKGRWKCFLASSHTLTLSQWAVSLQLRQHKNWQPGAKSPACREKTQLTGQRDGPGPVQTAQDLHQGAAFTDITYLWRVPCTFLGL